MSPLRCISRRALCIRTNGLNLINLIRFFELRERLLKIKSKTETINEYESTFWELVIESEKEEEEAMHIKDTQKG
jgi:hypothetical protein